MRKHYLAIRLQQRQRRKTILLIGLSTEVNQIGQFGRGHLKSCVREGLVRLGDNAMIGQHRVRDHSYLALGHMASDTIVSRYCFLPSLWRGAATVLRVTDQAFFAKVGSGAFPRRLHVRVVATDAAHLASAASIALAK